MATENEPAKLLLPYLQRADELQKHEPLVSYYCRLYAMERGLKIPQRDRTKTTSALLVSLLNQLEKDKKSLKLAPEDSLYLEGFALNVFAKADKQDRAGRADLNTAKTFYAASIFFEILNPFGPLQPDIEEKQKYAAWKAADIRKALKEGRRPVPGPPGEGGDTVAIPDTTVGDASHLNDRSGSVYDSPSIPQPPWDGDKTTSDSYPSHQEGHQHSASIPSQSQNVVLPSPSSVEAPLSSYPAAGCPPDYHNQPPNNFITNDEQLWRLQRYHQQYHSAYDAQPHDMNPNFQSNPSFAESSLPSVPSHSPWYTATTTPEQYSSGTDPGSIPYSNSNYQPPPERIAEAHKAARFAVGALAFDEIDIAVDYLKKSLELLTNPSPSN